MTKEQFAQYLYQKGQNAFYSGRGPGRSQLSARGWIDAAREVQADSAQRQEEAMENHERRFGLY